MRDHSEDIHQLQDMENSPGNIHCDLEVVHVQIKFSKVKVKLNCQSVESLVSYTLLVSQTAAQMIGPFSGLDILVLGI